MKLEEIRVCVLRVGGTNCDAETKRAFENLGVQAEILHINEVVKSQNLLEYQVLVFPGGFSYGDYVRAGVIWANWILAKLGKELKAFVEDDRPVFGICNGFQVLVEAGLLPGFEGLSQYPEAALATNLPPGYNCRWVYLKCENNGKCIFSGKIPKGKVLRVPVAHSEGRFIFTKEQEKKLLEKLYENDQLVFRYCDRTGEYAEGNYPMNPNGSFHDIAGICNSEGTIFGLMPHPERAFYWWQQPNWTRQKRMPQYGDGKLIFESLINYLEKKS
ncbi:MAG: phosphoribosylformylglycinamidine synthase subunit PurQ [Candidatus Bathyarchaeota archaeon]|nr:phosphoribosylformylglycinamidine synthase subunit PurQ [Candidatus Bathyarchaeota archaeon]MDH5787037.1 phosphoribosylformylglycinamidine synthase subunit PurQ [Candidatus Bathyarchaeota archaeon]